MSEHKGPRPFVGDNITVSFGPIDVSCRIFEKPLSTPYFLQVGVMDLTNKDEVIKGIRDTAARKCWFLDEGIRGEKLNERFGIILDKGVVVDIYNFQNQPLSEDKLGKLSRTLGRYYESLKDKSLWKLESVQIRAQDTINSKNGQPYRGMEYPQQLRFELFPASFEEGIYRNTLNCSWAEGAVGHETAHVVLEDVVRRLWEQNSEELGWKSVLPLTLVQLPGGLQTTRVNIDYRNLPTEYASYQEDDDRADSTVAFLFDPSKLNGIRTQLLSEVLNLTTEDERELEVRKKEAKLPELSSLNIYLYSIAGLFGRINRGSVRRTALKPKVISLEEYRKSL
ncbi:MAG: hypothetical protein HYW86_02510 [Candidatus Roizmanbacteria bacterium]|nr:MAG: hypothetical protein HYW86_02510 [Candidatus Roizmanbacteria bacterium]